MPDRPVWSHITSQTGWIATLELVRRSSARSESSSIRIRQYYWRRSGGSGELGLIDDRQPKLEAIRMLLRATAIIVVIVVVSLAVKTDMAER
jgi:hypothetical protein